MIIAIIYGSMPSYPKTDFKNSESQPMELYQLRTFITVTEEQSISGAARRLAMTPSSVSTHIKALETELGVQLFVRTHQGVDLTDKGRILADHARQTLHAANGLSQQASALKQQLVGTLRLGLSVSSAVFDLAAFVKGVNSVHPDLDLRLSHGESSAIMHQLRYDALDAGIIYGQVLDDTLTGLPLGQAKLVVAIPAAWTARIPQMDTLADMPWINTGDDCPFQSLIQQFCQSHDLQPQHFIRSNSDQTRADLVRAGMGISLLEASDASHPDIAIVETEPLYCEVSLVYSAHRQFDPMISAVRDVVRQHPIA